MSVDAGVTVVVATYEGEAFVAEQVDSILNQSVLPIALIIADDGSTDGTVQAAVSAHRRHQAGDDVRLEIIPSATSGRGVAANLMGALQVVGTEFVAFADQDDVWLPTRLAATVELARSASVDVVGAGALLVNSRLRSLGQTVVEAQGMSDEELGRLQQPGGALAVLLRGNVIPGMTMTVRTAFAQQNPTPDGWIHDYWWALVAAASGRLAFVQEPQVLYRQHAANQVGMSETSGLPARWSQLRKAIAEVRGGKRLEVDTRELSQWDDLRKLTDFATSLEVQQALVAKADFEQWRSTLPGRSSGLLQLPWAAAYGPYRRFRRDWPRDLVRDVLRSLGVPPPPRAP